MQKTPQHLRWYHRGMIPQNNQQLYVKAHLSWICHVKFELSLITCKSFSELSSDCCADPVMLVPHLLQELQGQVSVLFCLFSASLPFYFIYVLIIKMIYKVSLSNAYNLILIDSLFPVSTSARSRAP